MTSSIEVRRVGFLRSSLRVKLAARGFFMLPNYMLSLTIFCSSSSRLILKGF